MAVMNGQLFLLGGYDVNAAEPKDYALRYDISGDTWTWLPDAPFSASGPYCAAVGDRVHLAGGWDDSLLYEHAALSSLGVWDSAPADLPWPDGYGLAATNGSLFYVYGSEQDDKALSFDPAGGDWQELAHLDVRRMSPGGGYAAGGLFAFNGGGAGNDVWAAHDSSVRYDLISGEWSAFALSPPLPVVAPASAFVLESGGAFVLIGGRNGDTVYDSTQLLRLCLAELKAIDPPAGLNDADVAIEISGEFFEADDEFYLSGPDKGRVDLSDAAVHDHDRASAVVPAGLAPGLYDLVAHSATGETSMLTNGYQVIDAGGDDDDDDTDDDDAGDDDLADDDDDDSDKGCCG